MVKSRIAGFEGQQQRQRRQCWYYCCCLLGARRKKITPEMTKLFNHLNINEYYSEWSQDEVHIVYFQTEYLDFFHFDLKMSEIN